MKKIILLICAFFSFHQGFAQQDLLNNENKWLLHYMVIDGTTIDVPQAQLPMYIPGIRFLGTDASNYSFTANVGGINSAFDLAPPLTISPTSFTIQQPSITLGDCAPNCLLESQYLSTIILGNATPSRTLNYEITDEGNNRKTLTITSPEGNIAVHGNYILSVKKFDKKRIVMYPNPVEKKLHFDFKGYYIEKMNVLSLVGTSIFEAKISNQQSTLDVSFLTAGIYFLKTTYKDGDTTISRFIKE